MRPSSKRLQPPASASINTAFIRIYGEQSAPSERVARAFQNAKNIKELLNFIAQLIAVLFIPNKLLILFHTEKISLTIPCFTFRIYFVISGTKR